MSETDRERLRIALSEVHAQLEAGESVDPELRALLRTVLEDIRALLDASKQPEAPLAGRVSEMALAFETDHPTIAGTLNRLTHMLSSMGI